ncbi:hypothetical protein ACWD25_57315 [Streptomyces sp. NPDC002920]
MSYRPYPNTDRALRQLTRRPSPEVEVPPALRPLAESMARLRVNTQRAVKALRVDTYRLSTRPRVVSGGS